MHYHQKREKEEQLYELITAEELSSEDIEKFLFENYHQALDS